MSDPRKQASSLPGLWEPGRVFSIGQAPESRGFGEHQRVETERAAIAAVVVGETTIESSSRYLRPAVLHFAFNLPHFRANALLRLKAESV